MDFAERYGPWAIVAGASEGIGRCLAARIAERGVRILLVAKDGPLEASAEQISAEHGTECRTARIDLAAEDAFERIADEVGDREIGLYVANAGGDASASHFLDYDREYWVRLARLNMLTTLQACHHFGQGMRERGRGGMLLINSGGCYGGGSYLATYNACKAFLLNFAEGLWAELRPYDVHVLTIALNITDTPNFRRIVEKTGMPLPEHMDQPDDVAQCALARLAHGPIHNYGLTDEEAAFGMEAAAERRARLIEIDKATRRIYGSRPESD